MEMKEGFDFQAESYKQPVLLKLYADWCGPCKRLEPVLEEVEAQANVLVLKVNIDVHTDLAQTLAVRGVPTLILVWEGGYLGSIVGVATLGQILKFIDEKLLTAT